MLEIDLPKFLAIAKGDLISFTPILKLKEQPSLEPLPQTVSLYEDNAPGARRTINLIAETDGAITLSGGDIGELVLQHFGDSDWEFWTKIPAAAMQQLAFTLLRERFAGRADAWDELKAFCVANGITHESGDWA